MGEKSKLLSRYRRLNHLYTIIDKNGKEVIFKLNKGQQVLYDREMEIRKEKGKVWLSILKARQIGFTTYKIIDKLDKALFYSNVTVNIVAHDRDKLKDIFKRVKYTYEKIPNIQMPDGKIWKKPEPKYDNVNEYYFPSNNSTIKITLDSRSGTLTDCHISEAASIDHFQDMMRATIPAAENADITIETTAKGMNEFKDFRDNNMQFEKIFIPRFTDDSYRSPAPRGYVCMKELKYIQERYNLDNDQMYRYETKYRDDIDGTLQEYPSEPIDAFISSGRPFYNLQAIKDYPIVVGVKDDIMDGVVWYNKTKTINALYGIDFSEGLDHGDYTVVRIRDRDLRLIATYRGIIEPGDVTNIVNFFRNNGIQGVIGPERNNHGHTFLHAAKSYKRYHNIYIPKVDKDDNKENKDGQRGRLTSMVTRPLMLDEHKEAIKNRILEMDDQLQSECYTFVVKNRKPQADEKCNDDVIMADAICLQMIKEPIQRESKEENITVSYDSLLY